MTMEKIESMDNVKKVVRSLLLSTPTGLTVNDLCSEYQLIEHRTLPYKQHGYNSAVDLVKSMPDVVRPVFYGGVMLLQGVADESTAHIKELVGRQRRTGRTSRIVRPQPENKPTKNIVPNFVRKRISQVVDGFPRGCSEVCFQNHFARRFAQRLEPARLGFASVQEILKTCSDIVTIKNTPEGMFIYPVVTKKYQNKLVPQQKPAPVLQINTAIPEVTKKEIYVVLSRRPTGIWTSRFILEFKEVHKKEFSCFKLGFGSIIEVMAKLPELVLITRPTPTGDWFLYPRYTQQVETRPSMILQNVIDSAVHPQQQQQVAKPIQPPATLRPKDAVAVHAQYSLKSPAQLDELIEIYLSYIIDPSTFWFQCATEHEKLKQFMHRLSTFYHDAFASYQYKFTSEHLKTEKICCALYEDGEWYRAFIKDILSPTEILVYYVDYGNEMVVDMTNIRLLKQEFVELSCQAVKGRLDGVLPFQKKWCQEATTAFFKATENRQLFGNTIYKIEDVFVLELIDTNTDVDIHIADILLDLNLAKEIPETPKKKVEQPEERPEEKPALIKQDLQNEFNKSERPSDSNGKPIPSNIEDDIKIAELDSEKTLYIVRYNNQPYLTSHNISQLFWSTDILRQMLRQKGLVVQSELLTREGNKKTFKLLEGSMGEQLRPLITMYKLESLLEMCKAFKSKPEYVEVVTELIEQSTNEQFWCRKIKTEEIAAEESKYKIQALQFKRKRLQLSMMTNTATENTLQELRDIENKLKSMKAC